MKNKINYFIHHTFVIGSIVMVCGAFLGNFLNFIFRLFMIKTLSVSEYGVLASLVSLITLPSFAGLAIVPTVVRFAGSYFTKGDISKARTLFIKIYKLFLFLVILVMMVFLFFTKQLGSFLHIENRMLIILAGIIVSLGLMGSVNTAFLQAKLKFTYIISTQLLGAIVKLLLGVILVYLGFSVEGAIIAILFSFFLPYLLSFIPIRFVFKVKSNTSEVVTSELFSYGIPAALCMLGLTSMITTDILLVKHFFDPINAGIYAGLSLIAQIIFFVSGPINSVMFPLIVQRHTKKERYNRLLVISLLFIGGLSCLITFFYFLFPQIILQLFLKNISSVVPSNILWIFGIYMSLYSIVTLFINFFLSIKKTKVYIPLISVAVTQTILIWLFHKSFIQIITISISLVSLLLIVLLLYYVGTIKNNG